MLINEMNGELVFVGTDLVTNATFPGAGGAVQRRVKEENTALKEQDVTVLAFKQLALSNVIRKDIIKRWDCG